MPRRSSAPSCRDEPLQAPCTGSSVSLSRRGKKSRRRYVRRSQATRDGLCAGLEDDLAALDGPA